MIQITHNAGFFSCCSIRLLNIIQYFNANRCLPRWVDSSQQFAWYKPSDQPHRDVTFCYFAPCQTPSIPFTKPIDTGDPTRSDFFQFDVYKEVDWDSLVPFVQAYFSPSQTIQTLTSSLEQKYKVDYDRTCVLFYRGNDKHRETALCGYGEYISQARRILEDDPTNQLRFLVQSDETGFIEAMLQAFPDRAFYFRDEIRHMSKRNDTVDRVMRDKNPFFSKQYLAVTWVMSQCKYVVCGSGNCSVWIMLYRGHARNVYQNLNGVWICG